MEPIYDYDPATTLDNAESIAIFLADALETNNVAYIATAIGVVARAKGINEVSKITGLSQEYINQSFSEQGNPSFKTILTIMQEFGLEMTVRPRVLSA